ncbi:MAG TPA: glycosyltransferase N-terminal domain-containing protein [Bacteroidales bacterium]|nr:glycosyltransferase N-terminal domain-containing protein [Bacteroidales bacterium]HQH14589.1 glycosyltransferase N-terminal domain-containing protein [Bacteroidales bacterium]
MFFFYNLFIQLYNLTIWLSKPFNNKAQLWIDGRKDVFKKIIKRVEHDKPIVWFHCASLGEFEQGRPVIESFKETFPEKQIILTFFSPSGFEIRKNYPGADYIFYLPADTRRNARRFIDLVKPEIAVFVKYEFWFNYMRELKRSYVPYIFISTIFRPKQHFFRKWGRWQIEQLRQADHFFVQNQSSADLLQKHGIEQVTLSGDTRFDRVHNIAKQKRVFPPIEIFKGESKIFLAGSTWQPDEELITELIKLNFDGLKIIIAPHEVHEARIQTLMRKLPDSAIRYSMADTSNVTEAPVMVIDTIGILSHIYKYATLAYIGGGFGSGIHNTLEAATFGVPVIFGPNFNKFHEAVDLIERGGAYNISSKSEFIEVINTLLNNQKKYEASSFAARNYVEQKQGATGIIVNYLKNISNNLTNFEK